MSTVETYSDTIEIFSSGKLGVSEQNSKFYVTAQLHTSKLIPKEVLKRYSKTGVNKEVRVFHISPEVDVRSFVGVVDEVWWDDGTDEPMVRLEIFDDTDTARKIRSILADDQGKPLDERRIKGISAGIYAQRDVKTKEIVKFHIREVSLAREPVCEECTIQEVVTYEKVKGMADEGKSVIELFEKIEKRFESTVEAQAKLIEELEAKVERYSKTIVLQEEEIERLNGLLNEGKEQIETFEKTIAEKEVAIETAKKEPLISQIVKFEQFDTGTEEGKKRLEKLQKLNADALTVLLEGYERQKKLAERGLSGAPSIGDMDASQMMIGQYEEMTPEQRKRLTDQMIDGIQSHRKPGDILGPIEGGF